jgi:alkaline phosphatase D
MSISNRREFVIRLGALSAAVAGSTVLSACGGGDADPVFNHGVASGDPLADRVILWTHAQVPNSEVAVNLTYEVATDAAFTNVVSRGQTQATAASGFTAKADATGLSAGMTYFYRFLSDHASSPIGVTKTLPDQTATTVSMAVMSCANYPAGYFNVYAEAARSGADVAVFLGDWIYEYAADGYASEDAAVLGRVVQPTTEILSLQDYRQRHAQYRTDPDAKNLLAKIPLIAVWDDHEFTNDTWMGGAENHDPATEGDWEARKAIAQQAYHEWMPIRTGRDKGLIYRSFDFGQLVSLHMLDTRVVGRDQQIDATLLATGDSATVAEYSSPTRQLLGTEQTTWLHGQMAASTATWQVLGQQVLMARMEFPASILGAIATSLEAGNAAVTDYLVARSTPEGSRTDAQRALLDPNSNPVLGYNLDAWDGYLVAREMVLSSAKSLNKKLVVLAGDTHNAWHSDLTLKGLLNSNDANVKVGEEFATSSVSSPGLEEYLAGLTPEQIAGIFTGVVTDNKWMDASRRGYLKMTFTATQVQGDWMFVDTVKSKTYTPSVGHTAIYTGIN